MKDELARRLDELADELLIDRADLIESIRDAIARAASERLGRERIETRYDESTGLFKLYECDEEAGSAREIKMEGLGRIAARVTRKTINEIASQTRAERTETEHAKLVGSVMTASVVRRGRDGTWLKVDRYEAFAPDEHTFEGEVFRQGRIVKVALIGYDRIGANRTYFIASRIDPMLLRKLIEIESPEARDKIVQIRAAAVSRMKRAKVALSSSLARVDPIGSVVGLRAERIESISRALDGARIDLIEHDEDPKIFIARALKPVSLESIEVEIADEGARLADVIVAESDLKRAIGKGGVNARLACELTGWRLDIMSPDERKDKLERISKADRSAPPDGIVRGLEKK